MAWATNSINQDQRRVDMSEKIALLEPSAAPFTILLRRLSKTAANNPKFQWLEDELAPKADAINAVGGYLAGDVALVVDNAAYFTQYDLVQVRRTREVMLVTAVTVATNTLTVIRAWGETVAAALVDNDPLLIIGSAAEEMAGARPVNQRVTTTQYNYTQIFRTALEVSRTLNQSALYGGKERARLRAKKGIEHNIDLERAFLFGERKEDLTGTAPRRSTRGIVRFLEADASNVHDAAGNLTEPLMEQYCETLFAHGNKTKLLLASRALVSRINSWGREKLHVVQSDNPKDRFYGLSISTYVTAHGVLKIVPHDLLEGTDYGEMGVILDMEFLKYRPLNGSDTTLRTNIQAPDIDGFRDEYLTEAGLELKLAKCHGLIKNIAA